MSTKTAFIEEVEDKVQRMYDNPDFVGILIERWHVAGDERQPAGVSFLLAEGNRGFVVWHVSQDDGLRLTVTPLFRGKA